MSENKIENVQELRTLDGVLQQVTGYGTPWKPVLQAIKNVNATFRLQPYDTGKYIRINSATDLNITIPNNTEFPVGGVISFRQVGVGAITLVADTGVTLNGELNSDGQYNVIQIINVGHLEWDVVGGIA